MNTYTIPSYPRRTLRPLQQPTSAQDFRPFAARSAAPVAILPVFRTIGIVAICAVSAPAIGSLAGWVAGLVGF